jgi:predicted HTH domain antitoxin
VVQPLNYVPFVKEQAKQELFEKFGWQKYEHKHYESRFTRFYESYWLPTKFGYDKRRAHFSSEILSGQMSREEALKKISLKAYDKETIMADFEYVATKLGISIEEFKSLMKGENRTFRDYKSQMTLIEVATKFSQLFGLEKRIIR